MIPSCDLNRALTIPKGLNIKTLFNPSRVVKKPYIPYPNCIRSYSRLIPSEL